jgi:uncharacterized protein YjbI with pentapeptide repeats
MMNDESRTIGQNELKVTKPVSVWNRNIKISPKELLRGIGKMAIKGASLDWSGVGDSALDTLDATGLQKEPGEIAWLLIYRSLISAISRLTHNYLDLFENPPDEKSVKEISDSFEKEMLKIEVTIDLEFFQKPGDLKLLKDLNALLVNWMKGLGASDDNAEKICNRLPDYFETALNEKWRAAPQDYLKLKEFFDTPFTKATEESRGWKLYNQWLKSQVNDRMFAEAFGVEKVYVQLRAYYKEKKGDDDKNLDPHGRETKNIVFDLETAFRKWLNNFSSDSAVRFISGGPGSGKSTFAKIFASRIANETNIPTLYIPLHLFDATDNLISAMEKYIKGNKLLSGNPLDAKEGKTRLFIIFDGLDELALQGKVASEVANAFVDEVLRRIHEGNVQGLQRQVIICGRTIAIQSVASKLRESKQISYVLPYFLKDQKKYKDPEKLLETDQRKIWWQLYGKAIDKNYPSMPDNLNRESLEEITAQPLLNYLVALSYDRKRIEFTDDTTLNQIYADLISEVYCRQYEGGRINVYVGGLKETEFVRVLEEIAVAIWHGDGRTATVSSIQEKCRSGGIQKYLDSFQEGAKAGVTRLLTAFYFRQSESLMDGDPTFEFTHKSFGEYLTALRILRLLRQIQTQRKRQHDDPDDGWSEKYSLERWTEFCSATAMDADLMRFINNEFGKMKHKDLSELQLIVCDLFTYTINHGLPFSSYFAQKDFKQHLILARNAEEALLAVHFGIVKITKQISKLNLESATAFGEWVSRLRGQRQGPQNKLALNSLGFLDLSGYLLDIQDFYRANLEGANLEGASLYSANLEGANLGGANLEGANLEGANLYSANLGGANLYSASLGGANLKGASLYSANLGRADLEGASLYSANLEGANLYSANLGWADLDMANLKGADLDMANLKGTILEKKNP